MDLPAMRSTQQFSVTLPTEMAEKVRSMVAAGDYASESEVIRDGLRALFARDRAIEAWLGADVAAAYDAMKADPSTTISLDEMRAILAAEYAQATGKK
jgi:putative addiction module CopG family antidote